MENEIIVESDDQEMEKKLPNFVIKEVTKKTTQSGSERLCI